MWSGQISAMLALLLLAQTSLYETPAAQVVVTKELAILLENDLRHLRAIDSSGAQKWRVLATKKPTGIQALFEHDGSVLLYAGEVARTVSRTGRLGPGISVPWLSSPGVRGCWLNRIQGACALYCPCQLQLVRCESAQRVGEPYSFHRACMRDLEGGNSCGCWGAGGDLIGRAQGLWLAVVERPNERGKKRRHYGSMIVAVDSSTGKERWRRSAPFAPATYVRGLGVTEDGAHFWLADAFGKLAVYESKTGKLLWKVEAPSGAHEPQSRIFALPEGLFWSRPQGAAMYEVRTGKRLWKTPAKGAALPQGIEVEQPLRIKAGRIVLLSPKDGAVKSSFSLEHPDGRLLSLKKGSWLAVDGERLKLIASDGALRASVKVPSGSSPFAGETVVGMTAQEGLRLFSRSLEPIGRLPGRHEVIAVEGALGAGRLWVRSLQKPHRARLIRCDATRDVTQPRERR